MTDVLSAPNEFLKHGSSTGPRISPTQRGQYQIGGWTVTLFSDPEVFTPTLTTSLLTEQVLSENVSVENALDLGCGLGPIAIALAKSGARRVSAVDLMSRACELARINVEINGVGDRVTVLQGDLFEPLRGKKFDLIVDDVSGVAAKVARLSRWFPDEVPLGGDDGSTLTVRMLKTVREYLVPGGELYFPVLSLSNRTHILSAAEAVFGERLQCIATKHVPFSPELKANLSTLIDLRERGLIQFDQVRSRCFWTLEIYRGIAAS